MSGKFIIAIPLLCAACCGCIRMRPMGHATEDFLAAKPYAGAEYATRVVTTAGDTIGAPALYERFFVRSGHTTLIFQSQPRREIDIADIRALTFDRRISIITTDSMELEAPAGTWWFHMENGAVTSWTGGRAALPIASSMTVSRDKIAHMLFEEEGPLMSWLLFSAGAAIGAGAVMAIASGQ